MILDRDLMRVPLPLIQSVMAKLRRLKEGETFRYETAGGNVIQAVVHLPDGGKNGLTVPVVDFTVNPGGD
jgi:hypothetical protein